MTVCLPCRAANHSLCLATGCLCQHRPTPIAPEPSGTDGITASPSESSQP